MQQGKFPLLIAQLTQTTEAFKSGLNEVAAIVQDEKFLNGLGLGVVLDCLVLLVTT